MCGIAGIMYKRSAGNVGDAMTSMLWSLQHRGPDSTGFALYGQRGKGDYVMWLKLREQTFETTESESLEAQQGDVFSAIKNIGGKILDSRIFHPYSLRLAVKYSGDVKRLVDFVEKKAEVEITSFGKSMELVKDVGLASQVADQYRLGSFKGTHALGHVRMATESTVDVSHAHPFWAYPYSDISVVHNGQITNYWKYRKLLELDGHRFRSRCDSELIAVYLAVKMREGMNLKNAMKLSIAELDGVFTYFVATNNELGVAKDLLAAKPLVVMEDQNAVALASEEIALRAVFPKEIDSWDPYDGEVHVWSKSK
ncbi:MAG: class II glutamine amidotransferase [Candidatus Bathyarchaeia archaeon]